MKTRNGFVSNSSTSSFVVVGIQSEISEELRDKILEDNSTFALLDWYQEDKEGLCIPIASWNETDYPEIELDTEDIGRMEKKLQEVLNTTIKAKIYAGSRYS